MQPLFFVYTQNAYKKGRVRKWGDIDITENMSYNSSVAKLNPFRYRGYYYDAETGLYYLNSRYYDPSIGRFINADDISYIQPTDINGLNLFAYCGNNPVMYTDPEGTWSWSSFWRGVVNVLTGVGAIVAGALVIASGVAGVGMLVVAGVTITAGALTTINGGADIGEAISGYNFVRDGIFGGNQSAYNLYSGITAGVAAVGSAICGGWLRYNAPRINAYKNIEAYQYYSVDGYMWLCLVCLAFIVIAFACAYRKVIINTKMGIVSIYRTIPIKINVKEITLIKHTRDGWKVFSKHKKIFALCDRRDSYPIEFYKWIVEKSCCEEERPKGYVGRNDKF